MGTLRIGDRLLDGDQVISALVQYKLLESLVGNLILDKVIEEVPLSHQDVFYALTGATTGVPDDFQAFLGQWCQQKSVTPEYFTAVVLRELRVEKFKQMFFASQIESEFLQNKMEFDQVEYSLIQLNDLLLAQELYFQIRDDRAEFAQLAQRYSMGSEGETGGWVGPMPLSSLPAEVALLFRSGQQGSVYGPVPVGDRFWVVRLEHLTTARLTESMRSNLLNRLYTRWLNAQVQAVIATPGAIALQTDASQSPVSSLM